MKKLKLQRQTLRTLQSADLSRALGGVEQTVEWPSYYCGPAPSESCPTRVGCPPNPTLGCTTFPNHPF